MATKKSKKPAQTPKSTKGTSIRKRTDKAAAAPVAAEAAKFQRRSALHPAAGVVAEGAEPMACQEMIAAMAQKGLWTSPAGKTPAATLYSSILKEIRTKGAQARFQKTARGKFART